jgi:LPS-assembly protein
MSASAANKYLLALFSALLVLSAARVQSASETEGRGHLLDEGLSWQRCGPDAGLQNTSPDFSTQFDTTNIDADALEFHKDNEIATFTGDVSVTRGSKTLLADWARYDKGSELTEVRGDVFYRDPELRLLADEGKFHLKNNKGSITNIKAYRLPSAGARGDADQAFMHDKDRSTFLGASYTTCRPGNEDWKLTADKVDIDKAEGVGVARNAKITLKGVPLLYAPYFSFPIDKRRKSGFLMPTIGSLSSTGLDITTPYYLNLAPNYDATISPRYMNDHGLMLGGEFRHMAPRSYSTFKGEMIDDRKPPSSEDSFRGSWALRHTSNYGRWYNRIQADHVSDKSYLSDFGSNIGVTSKVRLERTAESTYYGDFWNLTTRMQNFQTIDRSLSDEFSRLPQLVLNASLPTANGFTLGLTGEYVAFDRDNSLTGQRLDLLPSIGYSLYRSWGFVRPKASVRYTGYQLDNLRYSSLTDSNPDRFVPTFSLDSGLYFDRQASWFGQTATQTLEPRLFYLNTPYKKQDDIPIFDTGLYGINFDNLFRENRFVGADRVGDANQLTTALTSRFLSQDSGEEWLSASLGQIHYFRDRKVQLNKTGTSKKDQLSSSSVLGELSSQITPNTRIRTFVEWDSEQNDSKKSVAELHYRDPDRHILNLSYSYDDKENESPTAQKQVDAAFYWPVGNNWSLIGRWNYSIEDKKTLDRFAGFEYDSCCWAFRFIGRHFVNDNARTSKVDTTTGVFLQLELKGLGSIGKADQVIADGVLGYTLR